MIILSKGCKTDKFESQHSQNLSFANIRGLPSNFVERNSFPESKFPNILAICVANLDDSIDYRNFSVRGYLPLIRKTCFTHRYGLTSYMKEGLPFGRELSLKNSASS